jgi:hypothetical protein
MGVRNYKSTTAKIQKMMSSALNGIKFWTSLSLLAGPSLNRLKFTYPGRQSYFRSADHRIGVSQSLSESEGRTNLRIAVVLNVLRF